MKKATLLALALVIPVTATAADKDSVYAWGAWSQNIQPAAGPRIEVAPAAVAQPRINFRPNENPSFDRKAETPPVVTPPPIVETPPVVTPPPVVETPPVVTPPPVVETPPVITPPPVVETPPVITPPPVVETPPVVTPPPVVETPPTNIVTGSSDITQDAVLTPPPSRTPPPPPGT